MTLSRFGETLSTVLDAASRSMKASPLVRRLLRSARVPVALLAVASATVSSSGDALAQSRAPLPSAPPAPLAVRVIAPSPDPPWTLRIDNEGDRPLRIPADIRLLSFEIQRPGKASTWEPCRPAPGQKPSSFPQARAVYLRPGESWVEQFDPRLFCFGLQGDRLRGGTLVRPRFGFGKQGWAPNREPFAVQSTDEPASAAPARELHAPTFLLSYAPAEIAPIAPAPLHATYANEPLGKAPPPPPPPPAHHAPHPHPHGEDARDVDGNPLSTDDEASKSTNQADIDARQEPPPPVDDAAPPPKPPSPAEPGRHRHVSDQRRTHDEAVELEAQRAKERELDQEKAMRETYVDETIGVGRRDRQAPDLDLYVDGWSDGAAPRDITLSIHARNEGGRALAAVLRSRMLRFRVEGPLTPQNQTLATVECIVDARSHGVPVEMVRDYRAGARLDIPFLLAEVCPRGTFDRPGLFRVTPLLVSQIEGEAVQHRDAFQGRVRALQPALARIGSSRLPFYDAPPRTVRTETIGRDPDEGMPAAAADQAASEEATSEGATSETPGATAPSPAP